MQYLDAVSSGLAVLAVWRSVRLGGGPGSERLRGSPLVTGIPGQGKKGSRPGGGELGYQLAVSRVQPLVTVRCRSDPTAWPEARGP